MKKLFCVILIGFAIIASCGDNEIPTSDSILGYELLSELNGHWVGQNETAFGIFDWFAFDFRPISASHSHSIYEGGTVQNIITSVFIADYDGKQQIMARNGGWLGTQYRATYFVLDRAERDQGYSYYRLVDAIGGIKRSYMEFSFSNDSIYIDAYKDNSGELDDPIHHMAFAGSNRNPSYAESAIKLFDYPQQVSEVDLNGQFTNLIDPDSALFLEEENDPFPKSDHGHLSDLTIDFKRNTESEAQPLLLFISTEEIISESGSINFDNLDNKVVRTIDVQGYENVYTTTYLHPDEYYITAFYDTDNNSIPSSGDYTSSSTLKQVSAESIETTEVSIDLLIK